MEQHFYQVSVRLGVRSEDPDQTMREIIEAVSEQAHSIPDSVAARITGVVAVTLYNARAVREL